VSDLPRSVDVAVVGAGLAGLCAARELDGRASVVLLEATDRPGGRVRTDLVDGFRLDRGFQVHNPAYPEARRVLDHTALDLRPFTSGALVHLDGRLHRVANPRRHPRHALATLRAPIGTRADKLRLVALTARALALPPQRLLAGAERTTYEALRARGLSEEVIDRFLRPFLAGVLLDTELRASSHLFDLLWRTFALGTQCVPAQGMGAIPAQLAAALRPGTLHLSTPVEAVRPTSVSTAAGTVHARAVILATDPPTAGRLLPSLPVPAINAVSTYYHAAPVSPLGEATIVLDGDRRGPVVNTVVLTEAAPTYSSDGRALVSSSVVGSEVPPEPVVRRELGRLYGVDPGSWQHLETVHVRHALPDQRPPQGRFAPPTAVDGIYVAGDHRDTASIQGAMHSGRRVARAVAQALKLSPGERRA